MSAGIQGSIGKNRGRAVVALLLLMGAAVFAGLGVWQWWRAGEQQKLEERAFEAREAAPIDLTRVMPGEADRFRAATARGEFLPAPYFVEGRRDRGRTGYGVIGVLRLPEGFHVLVDLGWSAEPYMALAPGEVTVQGRLAMPMLPALRLGDPTGPVRPYVDPAALSVELGVPVAPLVLIEGADNPPVQGKRGMHIGYALQWFAFAAIALVAGVRLARGSALVRHLPLTSMVLVFAAPFVGAWMLILKPELLPDVHGNRGELIEPPRQVSPGNGWVLAIPASKGCDAGCSRSLQAAERVRRALGEDGRRVRPPIACTFDRTEAPCPALSTVTGEGMALVVVDPLGYAVLRYREDFSPYDLLDDMERLLRVSRHWRSNAPQ